MRMRTRGEWRLNAWVTAVLLVGIAAAANLLAKEHLRWRADLSEEGFLDAEPVAERMLAELDDVLAVKAYFTGELRHGPVQVAKSRMIDLLGELEDRARGRMEVTYVDPNASSEARLEAARYGIEPVPLRAIQGTSALTQDVWLGLVLRYRGREAAIPFALPQTLHYLFLSELNRLQRDEDVSVAFATGRDPLGSDGGAPAPYGEAMELVRGQYRVRELRDLADGTPVPDDVAVLVVARPDWLHPRAVFAIDQHLQRGGHALILAERLRVDLERYEARLVDPGLDELFAAWGIRLTDELVWDREANWMRVEGAGRTQFPFWVNVGDAGMEASVPATGKLPGADLFWTHAIVPVDPVVPGVEVTSLVRSSKDSWLVPPEDAMQTPDAQLQARAVELLATEPGAPRDLFVSVAGRLPSPFAEPSSGGAPTVRDAVEETLWAEDVRAALRDDREPPPRPGGTTDEPVLSAAASAQVVVCADADWAQDGRTFTERNRVLFAALVDWLALEDDLVALRARLPRDRRIRDLEAEEREARGLPALDASGGLAVEPADPGLVAEAEEAAATARRLYVLAATGGALLAALVLGLGGRALLVGRVSA